MEIRVNFENKEVLSASYIDILSVIKQINESTPNVIIEVTGEAIISDNFKNSRIESIKNTIINLGIDEKKIIIKNNDLSDFNNCTIKAYTIQAKQIDVENKKPAKKPLIDYLEKYTRLGYYGSALIGSLIVAGAGAGLYQIDTVKEFVHKTDEKVDTIKKKQEVLIKDVNDIKENKIVSTPKEKVIIKEVTTTETIKESQPTVVNVVEEKPKKYFNTSVNENVSTTKETNSKSTMPNEIKLTSNQEKKLKNNTSIELYNKEILYLKGVEIPRNTFIIGTIKEVNSEFIIKIDRIKSTYVNYQCKVENNISENVIFTFKLN